MDNPCPFVTRSLRILESADDEKLEFVDVRPNNIAGKHWRSNMRALLPVSTDSPVDAVEVPERLESQSPVNTSQANVLAAEAKAAFAAKFKTPSVQPAKSTKPAKVTKSPEINTDVARITLPPSDQALVEQPDAPSRPAAAASVQPSAAPTPRSSVPLPDSAEAYPVNVVEDVEDDIVPDKPAKKGVGKKGKKSKNKRDKPVESKSAMSWTMRR